MFKLALVTGATSGLGKELCLLLARKKISLLITGRDQKALKALSQELAVPVTYLAVDLSDPIERKQIVAWIRERTPDLIINNAGFGLYGDALSFSTQEQLEILEVNAAALLEFTLEGARALKQRKKKGTILNISSAAAFFPFPSLSVYAASKTFVKEFSQALDVEMAPYNIRVLTACPGQIDTAFQKRAAKGYPQKKAGYSFSAHKAAALLFQQIEKGDRLTILDRVYPPLVFLARFLIPRPWLYKLLRSNISQRIRSR